MHLSNFSHTYISVCSRLVFCNKESAFLNSIAVHEALHDNVRNDLFR